MSLVLQAQNKTVVTRFDNVYVFSLSFDQKASCKKNQRVYIGSNKDTLSFLIYDKVYEFIIGEYKIIGKSLDGIIISEKIYIDTEYKERYDINWYENFKSKNEPGFLIFIVNIDWIGPTFVISNNDICSEPEKVLEQLKESDARDKNDEGN